HSRIFSGEAREMRIALNESGSLGFSKKLKMSRMWFFLFPCCRCYLRSLFEIDREIGRSRVLGRQILPISRSPCSLILRPRAPAVDRARRAPRSGTAPEARSEEHTSELQSQSNLVCRLLLEKKKKNREGTLPAKLKLPIKHPKTSQLHKQTLITTVPPPPLQ